MTTGEVFAKFKHLSSEEQRAFDRWLQGCAVVGFILGIGFDEMRLVVEELWPELADKLPPTKPQG
jgi:hypothetical protein